MRFGLLVVAWAALAASALARTDEVSLATIEAALLARQDADGGWGLHEPRRQRSERRSARLHADRALATRFALAALDFGAPSSAKRVAQERARAWLARQAAAPREVATGPGVAPAEARPVAHLALLRSAIEGFESSPGRLSEDALLLAIEASYRGRHDAERAAARVPAWRADFGLAELELTERLSRAVELLPPAHASRYESRLLDEARAALSDDGLVRDPLRASAVSSVGTARALLVLRRVKARAG